MILTALLAASAFASTIEDFSPMIPGTKWTYEDGNGLQLVEQLREPIDIGKGVMAYPKSSSASRNASAAELYRIQDNTLEMVGYLDKSKKESPINLFSPPQPVLRVASGKAEWQYSTELPTTQGPVLQLVHADSNHGPKRKILDREVETLIVHVFSQIGNDKEGVQIRQDAVYGKGIGLVEMTEATKAGGRTVKRVLKLVKFEPPQG